jgi:hypothetical protein
MDIRGNPLGYFGKIRDIGLKDARHHTDKAIAALAKPAITGTARG